jgi:hypothetical protein
VGSGAPARAHGRGMMDPPIEHSNWLADLAARIKVEHTAIADALKDSLRHAIVAGELLIEAKAQVLHGQWLPWLKDHCCISERTAQLYMRVAKNRADIEAKLAEDAAGDLTLSEAAAMLALSSDTRALFRFLKGLEGIDLDDPDAIIKLATESKIPVIHDPSYNTFAGRNEEERRDWWLFMTFLVTHVNHRPQGAIYHTEWVRNRFHSVAEWLGPGGDAFCRACGMSAMGEKIKAAWAEYHEAHKHLTEGEAELLLVELDKQPGMEIPKSAMTVADFKKRRRRGGTHDRAAD